jgi:hypothetical protein
MKHRYAASKSLLINSASPVNRRRSHVCAGGRVLFVVLVVCACFASACGRKGDPFLSVPFAPSKVRALSAVARPGEVLLQWQAPRDNTDESELRDLAGFHIYRAQELFDDYCVTCPRRWELLFDYEYRGLTGHKPARRFYYYRDTAVRPGMVYEYRVRAYNAAGTPGPHPDSLVVQYDAAPRVPQDLVCERRNRLIVLGWKPVGMLVDGRPADDILGYNVYRRVDAEEYDMPLNDQPVAAVSFEDMPPAYDTIYWYTVRAVRVYASSVIESAAAPEIRLAYLDSTPPTAPRFLTAIPQPDGVLLKWMAKSEKGLAGYHVYRRTAGTGEFKRMNPELLVESAWLDTAAVKRQRYEYAVSAVDDSLSANESQLSETVYIHYIVN